MASLAVAWKRWRGRSQRVIVRSRSDSPKTSAEDAKQAASDAVFWTMCAAAYVVYRVKSWYRGHGRGDPTVRKLKSE